MRKFSPNEQNAHPTHSEDKLFAQRKLITELCTMVNAGLWEYDMRTGEGVWTAEVAHIHEVEITTKISLNFALQFFNVEHRRIIEQAIHEAVHFGKDYDLESELITATGNHKWVHTKGWPIVREGEVIRLQGIVQDISGIKYTKDFLQKQQYLMQSYLDADQAVMMSLGRKGEIKLINQMGCHLLGRSERDLLGRNWFEIALQQPYGMETVFPLFLGAIEGKLSCPEKITSEICCSGGDAFLISWQISLLYDKSGIPCGALCSGLDITEQEKYRETSEENAEKLRLFIEHAPAALAIFDRQMRYLAASRRWITDYSLDGLNIIGQSHYDIFPEIPETWKSFHRRSMNGESIRKQKDLLLRQDGEKHYENWEILPWHTKNGDIGGIIIFSENLTKEWQLMEAIKEREARYYGLFRHSPEAIIVSKEKQILLVNDAAVKLFHAKNEDQLIGKSVYDLVGPQFHKTRQQNIQKALQNLTPIPLREEQFMRLDGEFFDGEVISVPIKFDDEFNIYSLVRDISERKSMRRQIIDIATNEQIRIGGEIHDGVGQELTALDLIMHRLERQATTKPSDINQIRVSLMELRRQLREAVKSVRLLAKGLSPAHMGPGGLPGELSRFAATVQKASDIQCQFTTFGLLPDLDKATAVHLYYMAQEAVNNALKHSSADKIDILYEYDGNNLNLSVADNGVGMEFSNTRKSGVGLMIMHYRADIIGATLSITSETKGTRILINLTHQYNE